MCMFCWSLFLLLHLFLYLFCHFVFCFLITPLVSSNSSYYSQKSMTFFINISITCNFCVICKMQLKTFFINNTLLGLLQVVIQKLQVSWTLWKRAKYNFWTIVQNHGTWKWKTVVHSWCFTSPFLNRAVGGIAWVCSLKWSHISLILLVYQIIYLPNHCFFNLIRKAFEFILISLI
jgi:hypothetical protein